MGRFARILESFAGMRVVVVGDVMLDEYLHGTVRRTSPEAPVMVVRRTGVDTALGGAANVARNVCALGASATIIGVSGDDAPGTELRAVADGVEGLQARIVRDRGRPTTRKTRVLATHGQQVLRIDDESCEPLTADVEAELVGLLRSECKHADLLLISDYAKGVVSSDVAQEAVRLGREHGIPVVANIKPECPSRFRGAALVTLNRTESGRMTGAEPVGLQGGAVAAETVARMTGAEAAVVSLGAEGMSGWWGGGAACVRALAVDAYDPSGAGDTLLASVGLAVAQGGLSPAALELSSVCCGLVVRHQGVAVLSASDLASLAAFDAVLHETRHEGYPPFS